MRRRLILALVTFLLLTMASPAGAKGPLEVTITGPGIDVPISVEGNGEPGSGTAFGVFVDATGFWDLVAGVDIDGSGLAVLGTAPTENLGDAYHLLWDLGNSDVGAVMYPNAEGGAVTYVEPNTYVSDYQMYAKGGWYVSPVPVTRILEGYGVAMVSEPTTTAPAPAPKTVEVVVQQTSSPHAVDATTGSSATSVAAWALASLVGVCGAAVWAWRRRPVRHAGH